MNQWLNAGAFVRAWRRPVVPLGNVIAILGEGRRSWLVMTRSNAVRLERLTRLGSVLSIAGRTTAISPMGLENCMSAQAISKYHPGVAGITVGFAAVLAAAAFGGEPDLTFFGWSDQHIQTNGDGHHLAPAIDAMNRLPGTKYPDRFGGTVAAPAFVFGCGDITEWPTKAACDTYNDLVTRRCGSARRSRGQPR